MLRALQSSTAASGGGSDGVSSQYVARCVHDTSSTMPLKEAHRDLTACHIVVETGIAGRLLYSVGFEVCSRIE